MRKLLIACIMVFLAAPLWAQQEITYEPTGRLLNDYSGILTPAQHDSLETRLVSFNDSTSNQILVIFTPLLGDEEIMDLGTSIGYEWGIGEKELDNGLVIMVKTKCEEEPFGDVAIVTGFGLEGALPDAYCARIIDDYMIPHLAEGDYYTAVNAALDVLEPICLGEFGSVYPDEEELTAGERILEIIIMIILGGLFIVPSIWFLRQVWKGVKAGLNSEPGQNTSSTHTSSHSSSRSYSSSSRSRSSSSSSRSSSSSSRSRSGRGGSFGGGGSHRRF